MYCSAFSVIIHSIAKLKKAIFTVALLKNDFNIDKLCTTYYKKDINKKASHFCEALSDLDYQKF